MLYPLCYGCQWVELNFYPYKLSNLKFTPLPSLHVDFYSRCVVNSVFVNCPLNSITQYTALINICRFLINVVKFYANHYEIGPFHHFGRAALKKGRNGTNKKNLTLAWTRTHVLGISSAYALPTNLRVPVGGT